MTVLREATLPFSLSPEASVRLSTFGRERGMRDGGAVASLSPAAGEIV